MPIFHRDNHGDSKKNLYRYNIPGQLVTKRVFESMLFAFFKFCKMPVGEAKIKSLTVILKIAN